MRRAGGRGRSGAGIAVALVAVLSGCAWQNELVSTNADGTDSADGEVAGAWSPWASSPDGTKVAITTIAGDLGPTDTNGQDDVYVKELDEGAYTLVSVNSAGTDSANGESRRPTFSPDGTKVAFTTTAGDLGPTDTNGLQDVYVRDLAAGTTTLVSVDAGGSDGGNDSSSVAGFSPDGTKILFTSSAGDLGPTDTNGLQDVYVRDLVAGTTTLVSANGSGTDSANGASRRPSFSPDGTKVVFETLGSNLGPVDIDWVDGEEPDIYVRDLVAGTTSLVSVSEWGSNSGNGASMAPEFSPDGTKVVFESLADDLGPGGSDCRFAWPRPPAPPRWPCRNVFLRDLVTQTTSLVSLNAAGTGGGHGFSGGDITAGNTNATFSSDGTKVLFSSTADDLDPAVDGGGLFVRDLVAGSTELVNVNEDGDSSNGYVSNASFDPGGTRVVFSTVASDLGFPDNNYTMDVYVRDLEHDVTNPVSINHERTTTGNGESDVGGFTPDGEHILFWSKASDLVSTDTNGARDLFLASRYLPPEE